MYTFVSTIVLPPTNIFANQVDAITLASKLTKMHDVTQNAEIIVDPFLTRHPRSMTEDDDGNQNDILHNEHTHFRVPS